LVNHNRPDPTFRPNSSASSSHVLATRPFSERKSSTSPLSARQVLRSVIRRPRQAVAC
jgi:hypothetical protein